MATVLNLFGFALAAVYCLPWLVLCSFLPFVMGWKMYYLGGAMDLLKRTYRLGPDDDSITVIQLLGGIFAALTSLLFANLNRVLFSKGSTWVQHFLMFALTASTGLFLWAAKEDFDRDQPREKAHFWRFGLFIVLSCLGDAAQSSFKDGILGSFYHSKSRHSRLFVEQVSEALGIAFGLYRARQVDSIRKKRAVAYSEQTFMLFAFFFLAIALTLAVAFVMNGMLKAKFRSFPKWFEQSCVVRQSSSDEEDDSDDFLPKSKFSRSWLFRAMTLCESLSLFAKNGFVFWGMYHMLEATGEELSVVYYCVQIAVGSGIGASAGSCILKFHVDKFRRIDRFFHAVLILASSFSLTCLVSSLLIPSWNLSVLSLNCLFCVCHTAYFASTTLSHILIDEVQFCLIEPRYREFGVTAEKCVEELGDAASPWAVEHLMNSFGIKVAQAMLWTLPGSIFLGILIYIPLSLYAMTRKEVKQNESVMMVTSNKEPDC